MEWERRDRRAIGKAIRKTLKTGSGSCVLLDGTMIIVTRDKAGLDSGGCVQFDLPRWNQIIGAKG